MKKVLAALLATAMTMSISSVAFAAANAGDLTIGGSLTVSTGDATDAWGINYNNITHKSSWKLQDVAKDQTATVYTYGSTKEAVVVLYNLPKDVDIHVTDGHVKVSTKKVDVNVLRPGTSIKDAAGNVLYTNNSGENEGWFKTADGYQIVDGGSYARILTIKDDHGLNELNMDDFTVEVDVRDGNTFNIEGQSAYSNIREVTDDDRLSVNESDDKGSVFDFDEKITETARIRVNEYVDLYFKGNYGTDKENLRVWDDEVEEVADYLDDADVDFYDFRAHPKFASSVKVIIDADENSFLYEYKDGEITKVDAKYESDGWAFTTKVLGTYFTTEEEYAEGVIKGEETPDKDESPIENDNTDKVNPGTGASDMVGAAAVAAVLSLVSAGAVAFKKASK